MTRILTLTLLLCLFPSLANAGIIYSFGQSNYTVAAGGTVNVSVFLQQTGTDTILTDFGIISSGVNVFFNEPVIPSDPAEVLALGDITPSPAFDDPVLTDVFLNPGVSAGMIGAVDILTPAIKGNSILLGTFKFTAGSVAGEVTHLRATDFDSLFDETIADNGDVLDSIIQDGFATITVNGTAAVPEPASGLLLGSAVLAGLYRERRRRRRNLQKQQIG